MDNNEMVPALMREEANESDEPLDLAWTIRTDGIRVSLFINLFR
jgi:hypothetical protein